MIVDEKTGDKGFMEEGIVAREVSRYLGKIPRQYVSAGVHAYSHDCGVCQRRVEGVQVIEISLLALPA